MLGIDKFVKVPMSELTSVNGGGYYFIYHNMYWAITDDNELLFYRKKYVSPQCNSSKEIVERVLRRNIDCNIRVELIEYVFIPKDYCEF